MTFLWALAAVWVLAIAFFVALAVIFDWQERRELARYSKQLEEIRGLPETVDGPPMRRSV